MSGPLYALTIHEAAELLRRREITSLELTRAVLDRIEETEPRLNAFITVTAELALQQAQDADHRLERDEGHVLTGVPVAVKDIICTKGVRTTFGSLIYRDYVPTEDAVVVERVKNVQPRTRVGPGAGPGPTA